jgi:hypothetical protein
VTPAQFRKAALSLPDVVEGEHQDHPDFRTGGRVFATLHADGEWGMVKLPLGDQAQLLAAQPGVFVAANGAWGRAGCTNVRLAKATVAIVQDALTIAWQAAAKRVPTKRRGQGPGKQ